MSRKVWLQKRNALRAEKGNLKRLLKEASVSNNLSRRRVPEIERIARSLDMINEKLERIQEQGVRCSYTHNSSAYYAATKLYGDLSKLSTSRIKHLIENIRSDLNNEADEKLRMIEKGLTQELIVRDSQVKTHNITWRRWQKGPESVKFWRGRP